MTRNGHKRREELLKSLTSLFTHLRKNGLGFPLLKLNVNKSLYTMNEVFVTRNQCVLAFKESSWIEGNVIGIHLSLLVVFPFLDRQSQCYCLFEQTLVFSSSLTLPLSKYLFVYPQLAFWFFFAKNFSFFPNK